LALGACGDDERASPSSDSAGGGDTGADVTDTAQMPDLVGGDSVATGTDLVTHADRGAGVTATTVDASDATAWVYLDLAGRAQVTPADPTDDATWDLAFQRFRIAANGGVSGTGGVAVAILDDADFDALTVAPADGYREDAADGDDEDTDLDLGFLVDGGWYAYDAVNHTLAPREGRVYVVRDRAGDHFKVRVVDYYDAAGSPGVVTFFWAPIDPPPAVVPDDQLDLTAPSAGVAWLDLSAGEIATPSDPATSPGWDLGIHGGVSLATNGGTSGAGLGGARLADGAYDALVATDTVGFEVDAMLPLPGPPGSGEISANPALAGWYDYDPSSHTLAPKAQAYVVRRADGSYAKLAIVAVDGEAWSLRSAPLARAPEAHTTSVSAPSGADPVYLSFRAGGVVAVADAATSTAWDVAISYLTLRTNGGTSGSGEGAAIRLADADFDAVDAVPAGATWVEDAMAPLPGPPGSGEVSGNAALGAWYDYDSTAHTVSATAGVVFLVRAADGSLVKLAITSSDGTDYALRWTYAGPGQTTFAPETP
ncbi:MAG: hypothetical protein KC635_18115, partial [Myxococcales bacterium]|nr:hypothetical protein [Myxococcales bacterium]